MAFCLNRDESLPVDHQFYLGLDYYRNRQCGFNWIVARTPTFLSRRGLLRLFPDSYRRVLECSKFNCRSESINAKSGWTSSTSIFRRCFFLLSFQRFFKTPSPSSFHVYLVEVMAAKSRNGTATTIHWESVHSHRWGDNGRRQTHPARDGRLFTMFCALTFWDLGISTPPAHQGVGSTLFFLSL